MQASQRRFVLDLFDWPSGASKGHRDPAAGPAPALVVKTVRASAGAAAGALTRVPGLAVVHLIRDPRGRLHSLRGLAAVGTGYGAPAGGNWSAAAAPGSVDEDCSEVLRQMDRLQSSDRQSNLERSSALWLAIFIFFLNLFS